jgi:hypothetical protein
MSSESSISSGISLVYVGCRNVESTLGGKVCVLYLKFLRRLTPSLE